MKKVAPKARSFDRESPFTMPAIACSRMPKCRFFPAGLSASKSPAPSYVSVVLFDGPRSAEPPRNQGMFCARTFSTAPEASRPATPLGSAGKLGRLRSHPAGSSRLRTARTDAFIERRQRLLGHEELGVFRPAIGALGELHFVFTQGLAMGGG